MQSKKRTTIMSGPIVTSDEIRDIKELIYHSSHKWYDIGKALGIDEHRLRNIEKDEDGDQRRLQATLFQWYKNERQPSWQIIIDALRSKTVDEKNVADILVRSKRVSVGTSSTDGQATAPPAKLQVMRSRTFSASADLPEELCCMSWKMSDSSAPERVLRPIGAIVHDNIAYFRNFRTHTVLSYNNTTQKWERLPDCLVADTSLVVLPVISKGVTQFRLHTVGGRNPKDHRDDPGDEFTGNLFQLQSLRAGGPSTWNHADYPDMNSKRSQVMVVYRDGYVIAAGGCGNRGAINTVEVLNTKQRPHMAWYEVASLPQPVYKASRCVCDGFLYILGGHVLDQSHGGFNATKCAYKAPIKELVDSQSQDDDVFEPINDLPLKESAFVSVSNHVVAIGGWKFDPKANQPMGTKLVHVLSGETWVKLGECLNEPRCQGFAVAFEDKIMAVGGHDKPNGLSTNSVEFASLNI